MQNLRFIKSDGSYPSATSVGVTTLANSGTYYAELGDQKVPWRGLMSIQWTYDGALTATITIEATNDQEAAITDATNTHWVDVSSIPDVTPAASAGTVIGSWADVGYARMRAKVVVGASGAGTLRGSFHAKKV